MLVLPHTPQLELITKLRLSRRRSPLGGHVQHDVDGVGLGRALASAHAPNLAEFGRVIYKTLGEKKAGREFLVMPGRAHREREAAAGESNLQRFFDREFLAALRSRATVPSKRAMLADFIASTIACLLSRPAVGGIGCHPWPPISFAIMTR